MKYQTKPLWQRWFSAITALVMVLGMFPFMPAQPVQAATQTLGGATVDGNLKIDIYDDGSIGLFRYDSANSGPDVWETLVYHDIGGGDIPNKNSRLQYTGGGYYFGWPDGTAPNGSDSQATAVSNTPVDDTVVTVFTAGNTRITQTVSYSDGDDFIRYDWAIQNTSGSALSDVRFFHGMDTCMGLDGYECGFISDTGAGLWLPEARAVGVRNVTGSTETRFYLQGVTPPESYNSLEYWWIWGNIADGDLSNGDGAPNYNLIEPDPDTDNGYALEWRYDGDLPAGNVWTITAYERFTVQPFDSVFVVAPPVTEIAQGASGDMIYTLTNDNDDASGVNVDLSVSKDQPTWAAALQGATTVNVPANSSITTTVRVTVPVGASIGDTGVITLTADGPSAGVSADAGTVKVTAGSTPTDYALTINKDGTGSGSVTKYPDRVTYTAGTVVTLTAVPSATSTFAGWSGAGLSGTTSPITLTMDASKEVTATFNAIAGDYALTVNKVGNGSVTKDPDQATYSDGSAIRLTAVASDTYLFAKWSGDLVTTTNPATVTMDANKTVTATFLTEDGDDDGDGVPNDIEIKYKTDPFDRDDPWGDDLPDENTGPTDDDDGDGVTNAWERVLGTDPNDPDSDSTKTTSDENDNDISDADEDFDGDGVPNDIEIKYGTDPLDPDDPWGDDLPDEDTDPTADDDNDGVPNAWEEILGTDPDDEDSDSEKTTPENENDNGTGDAEEDFDGDGISNAAEIDAGTDPLDGTDNDTVVEKVQTLVDASDDPSDGAPIPSDLTNTGLTNVITTSMGAYEVGFADPTALGLPPLSEPPTRDELQAVIDAINGGTDSDGDGICDATELDAGTDPLDGTDNDDDALEKPSTIVAASDLIPDNAPTRQDLLNTGLTDVYTNSMPAYERGLADPTALGLPPYSAPPTQAELQAVIDAVNALDSDNDGISDGAENDAGTDPNDGTDNDTVEEKVQTLVDASDDPADGYPMVNDLINTGLTGVISDSMGAYEEGFADPTELGLPPLSEPSTQEELQAVIDAVNGMTDSDGDGICDATELDAGTDPLDGTDNDTIEEKVQTLADASDIPADGAPTAQDLVNTGLTGVITDSMPAYEAGFADPVALGLLPLSEPPTQEELQAVIDAVNSMTDSDGDGICDATELDAGTDPLDGTDNDTVTEKVQTLVDASDDPSDGAPVPQDLVNTGLENVIPDSMVAYEEGFADPTALGLPPLSEPPTRDELQAVIDAVNGMTDSDGDGICDATELDAGTDPLDGTDNDDDALEKPSTIVAASDLIPDNAPTRQDLLNTGLTDVYTNSMPAYERGLADPTTLGLPPYSEPPTQAELQAVIDAVNALDSDNDGISDGAENDAGTDPNDGTDNDTVEEKVQTLVDASDDPADGYPMVNDLINTGLTGVISDSMGAYEEGFADPTELGLPPLSEPPTQEELQAVIDAVNGMTDSDGDGICDATELDAGTDPLDGTDNDMIEEKVQTLADASDIPADGAPTAQDLVNTGLTGVITDSMPAYEAGFADPVALGLPPLSAPPTQAELQAVIDAVNGMTDSDGDGICDATELDAGTDPLDGTDNDTVDEKVQTLVDASDDPADGSPTAQDLVNTGLTGVITDSMGAYEEGFADPESLGLPPFSEPPTQEELQAVIDAVNGIALTIDKIAEDVNGTPLEVGDLIRYTIYVTNTSSAVQTGVLITDVFPDGVALVGPTSLLPAGDQATWQVDVLNPGAMWTTVITMQVSGDISPIGGNVAMVSSDQTGKQQTEPVLPPGGGAVVGGGAPQAQDDAYSVPEGTASTLEVLENDSDPDGDTLTITQVSAPGHGAATTNGATIVYTPTAGYLGSDTFTYTITDGDLEDTAQVTLTVLPVADLAVEQDIAATISGYEIVIVARNLGPRDISAPGAVLSDTFAAEVGTTIDWTCTASGGAVCPDGSGSGNLEETLVTFPAAGVITYTVSAVGGADRIVWNAVSITPPASMFDLDMSNNRASRPTGYRSILPLIFKDASF